MSHNEWQSDLFDSDYITPHLIPLVEAIQRQIGTQKFNRADWTNDRGRPLTKALILQRVAQVAAQMADDQASKARSQGATFAGIGHALGISRQRAFQKFGPTPK